MLWLARFMLRHATPLSPAPPARLRSQEFNERWEVDKYFSASGYLPPTVKPFFVALPKDRASGSASSADWRRAIQEVDGGVKQHLRQSITGGFDEERFGARIGFGNLRRSGADAQCRLHRLKDMADISHHIISYFIISFQVFGGGARKSLSGFGTRHAGPATGAV